MILLLPLICPLLLSISEITSPFKQYGNTCVMLSAMLRRRDITKLLVDRGATLEQDRLLSSERSKYTPEQEHQRYQDYLRLLREFEGGGGGG